MCVCILVPRSFLGEKVFVYCQFQTRSHSFIPRRSPSLSIYKVGFGHLKPTRVRPQTITSCITTQSTHSLDFNTTYHIHTTYAYSCYKLSNPLSCSYSSLNHRVLQKKSNNIIPHKVKYGRYSFYSIAAIRRRHSKILITI